MECDQCGARRPPSGPCPYCGAPPPGRGSMRDARGHSGKGPVAPGPGRGGSGAGWGGSGGGWGDDDGGGGRSGGRYRQPDYEGVDLERALVPSMSLSPAEFGAGVPALPGAPSEEEERLLGIRRPVYIPATGQKRRGRLGGWRVISGVLSVMLTCIAACGVGGYFGRNLLTGLYRAPGGYNTPTSLSYADVPVTPVATAGPNSKYITSVTTSKRIDSNGHPIDVTSHFLVGDTVYVVVQVRNAPKGEHTVCAQWFLNGEDIRPSGQICKPINIADVNVTLLLPYPQPGEGMARIFWDAPAGDTDPPLNDPALAQTIYFGIYEPATPTSVPPTVTLQPKGAGTPATTPTVAH